MTNSEPAATKIRWGAKIWAVFTLLYLFYLIGLLTIGLVHGIDFLPRNNTPATWLENSYHLLPMALFFILLAVIPYHLLWKASVLKAKKYSLLLFFLHLYALLFEVHIVNWNLLVFGIPYFVGLILSLFLLKTPTG